MFNEQMIAGFEWRQIVPIQTKDGHFRVEITWALDRFRISVWRRVQEPEKFVAVHHSFSTRNAVKTANKLIRYYTKHSY
jgi:hypothetical protein